MSFGTKMLAAATVLIAAAACTDRRFVANAEAETIYHKDRYDRACVQVKGPVGCGELYETLLLLERHEPPGCDTTKPDTCKPAGLIPVANRVVKIGKVPAQEKKELKAAIKKVRTLP